MISPILRLAPLIAAVVLLAACGPDAPEQPKVVDELRVDIDAKNNCWMDGGAVECRSVAAAIRKKYPTSKPRVDLCVDKTSRFEASAEVMKSLQDGGVEVGTFTCDDKTKN